MKRNSISFACAVFFLFVIVTSCRGQKTTSLVNTLTFNADDFNSIRFDYDADDIYVLESKLAFTDHTALGSVGAYPDKTIALETRNGDMKVSRRSYEKK